MQMRMEGKLLSPGVEDGNDPRGGAHIFPVAAERDQGIGSGREKQVIERFLVFEDERVEFMRKGEYHMVISDTRDQLGVALHDPLLLQRGLTAGTVAVIAGTGVDLPVTTLRAFGNRVSELAGLAV